jgi:hypothetical membrane protein
MWLFCSQFFVVEELMRLVWITHNKNYSMTGNWVSDLGAVSSPLHWIMNASLVLQGVLIAGGAVLVRAFFPARWWYWLVLLLLVVSGVAMVVVGLYPEDVDIQTHGLAALYHLQAGNAALVLLGLIRIRRSKGQITLAAGAVGLAALQLLTYINAHPTTALALRAGLIERIAVYPLPLWLTWTGWLMLRPVRTTRAESQYARTA